MRLSHYHKHRGDAVFFTRRLHPDLFENNYDKVYASSIFKFSQPRLDRFHVIYPNAVVGGTGASDPTITIEKEIGSYSKYDYSIYPEFKNSIGFTQRGCRLKCPFCVVPKKEGKNRSVSTIYDIWRGGRYPKKMHLLDNDFFGQPEDQWRSRIQELKDGKFRVCFSQGINIRMINDDVAQALTEIEYRDTKFKTRRLYTAWDNLGDEKRFFDGVKILNKRGIPNKHLMVYMLIGYDKKETWDRIHYRFNKMAECGILPYPMVYDNDNKHLKRFQRWAVMGLYRVYTFDEFYKHQYPKDFNQYKEVQNF
jgi:pyruvate-formate lyase-activating enzyme